MSNRQIILLVLVVSTVTSIIASSAIFIFGRFLGVVDFKSNNNSINVPAVARERKDEPKSDNVVANRNIPTGVDTINSRKKEFPDNILSFICIVVSKEDNSLNVEAELPDFIELVDGNKLKIAITESTKISKVVMEEGRRRDATISAYDIMIGDRLVVEPIDTDLKNKSSVEAKTISIQYFDKEE